MTTPLQRLVTPAAAARRRDLLLELSGAMHRQSFGIQIEDDELRRFLTIELALLLANAADTIERLEELVHR